MSDGKTASGRLLLPEAVVLTHHPLPTAHHSLFTTHYYFFPAASKSFRYSPYPCAASSRTGMKRIDAEFMQ